MNPVTMPEFRIIVRHKGNKAYYEPQIKFNSYGFWPIRSIAETLSHDIIRKGNPNNDYLDQLSHMHDEFINNEYNLLFREKDCCIEIVDKIYEFYAECYPNYLKWVASETERLSKLPKSGSEVYRKPPRKTLREQLTWLIG